MSIESPDSLSRCWFASSTLLMTEEQANSKKRIINLLEEEPYLTRIGVKI